MEPPIGIFVAFLPLADPPGKAPNGEHDRKHVQRDANGPQNNTAVEIYIRIEMVIYKVFVF